MTMHDALDAVDAEVCGCCHASAPSHADWCPVPEVPLRPTAGEALRALSALGHVFFNGLRPGRDWTAALWRAALMGIAVSGSEDLVADGPARWANDAIISRMVGALLAVRSRDHERAATLLMDNLRSFRGLEKMRLAAAGARQPSLGDRWAFYFKPAGSHVDVTVHVGAPGSRALAGSLKLRESEALELGAVIAGTGVLLVRKPDFPASPDSSGSEVSS